MNATCLFGERDEKQKGKRERERERERERRRRRRAESREQRAVGLHLQTVTERLTSIIGNDVPPAARPREQNPGGKWLTKVDRIDSYPGGTLLAEGRGVPEQDAFTPPAPDDPAVALHD